MRVRHLHVHALVISRLQWGSTVLYGITKGLVNKLQMVYKCICKQDSLLHN